MKSVILTSFLSLMTVCMIAQWQTMTETGGVHVSRCSFPSSEVGYVIGTYSFTGASVVMKTIDGGESWTEILPPGTFDLIYLDLHFVSETEGYLSRRYQDGVELVVEVQHTIDGGENWENISPDNVDVGSGVAALSAVPEGTLAFGIGSQLHSSGNTGADWNTYELDDYYSPLCLDLFSNERGAAGIWDGTFNYMGSIYLTDDGGETWETYDFEDYYGAIMAIDVTDPQTVYGLSAGSGLPGSPATIYRTTNWGESWDNLPVDELGDYTASDLLSVNDTLYLLSWGLSEVLRSTDAGESFQFETETTNGNSCICASPENTIYVFGSYFEVIKKQSDNANDILYTPENGIAIYPNPTDGYISLFADNIPASVNIISSSGHMVIDERISTHRILIDLQPLPVGIYHLVVTGSDGLTFSKKIVRH
ncbi:MAG: T9SS type A sorting domain-containing protein [Flavobacteriales bacterium]|nr:T9SS type A sorting domain-containing protein [Flavobacteriales bacterium]